MTLRIKGTGYFDEIKLVPISFNAQVYAAVNLGSVLRTINTDIPLNLLLPHSFYTLSSLWS